MTILYALLVLIAAMLVNTITSLYDLFRTLLNSYSLGTQYKMNSIYGSELNSFIHIYWLGPYEAPSRLGLCHWLVGIIGIKMKSLAVAEQGTGSVEFGLNEVGSDSAASSARRVEEWFAI